MKKKNVLTYLNKDINWEKSADKSVLHIFIRIKSVDSNE